ncbi:uncharacterized protein EAE98_001339 [Botrytis deweyae]|uniref:Uncharacterized protein n=1 Tax=Botrytis deweyae TaxID=2478750 RepID=A0ABQ7J1N5_9HELO|nr:uncharacterized protein EAE98_001339 [Botrytis deweyae]KAF7939003.1 hypothetical protein EAE98_001339 [Botrytis deweyae]
MASFMEDERARNLREKLPSRNTKARRSSKSGKKLHVNVTSIEKRRPSPPPPSVENKAFKESSASSDLGTQGASGSFKRIFGTTASMFRDMSSILRNMTQRKDNPDVTSSPTNSEDLEKGDVRTEKNKPTEIKNDVEAPNGIDHEINVLREGLKEIKAEAVQNVDKASDKVPVTLDEMKSAPEHTENFVSVNEGVGIPEAKDEIDISNKCAQGSLLPILQANNRQAQNSVTVSQPVLPSTLDTIQEEQSAETKLPIFLGSNKVSSGRQLMQVGKPTGSDEKEIAETSNAHSETGLSIKEQFASRASAEERRIPLSKIDEALVKAYLLPYNPGEAPLQIRRTLDQYFYSHLVNTSQRDSDQVVYRYMRDKTSYDPKMFMVDQLWLWVISDETVISCCPQRWDIWSTSDSTQPVLVPTPLPSSTLPPHPPPNLHTQIEEKDALRQPSVSSSPLFEILPVRLEPLSKPPELALNPTEATQSGLKAFHISKGQERLNASNKMTDSRPLERSTPNQKRFEPKGGVLGWLSGAPKKSSKMPRAKSRRDQSRNTDDQHVTFDSPDSSTAEKRKRLAVLRQDPLNVHQKVLKYLQSSTRPPIVSPYDVANLVVDMCVNLFDQYQVPEEFQFFDFFERSIGVVIDKEAQCFRNFSDGLARAEPGLNSGNTESDGLFNITEEVQLLVEIRDIRDELAILQMILSDQLNPVEEFSQIIAQRRSQSNSMKDRTSDMMIKNYLYRIEKMERLADKTYLSLNHLLDLKQKQANVSEALSSRKQMESSTIQAAAANKLAETSLKQTYIATEQAFESVRQGRTVLVFTVVTIIFLPLSFMAAFFAINIDVFPFNDDGKLPLDYVLKYMLSISGAMSIPFILIALNQDRIAAALKANRRGSLRICFLVLLVIILLSVIWTTGLAEGIKAAVTAFFVLTVVVGSILYLYPTLAKSFIDISESGSEASSS